MEDGDYLSARLRFLELVLVPAGDIHNPLRQGGQSHPARVG